MKQLQTFSADLYYLIDDSMESVNVITDDTHPSLPDVDSENLLTDTMDAYTKVYEIVHMPHLWIVDTNIHAGAYGEFQTNLMRDFK